MRHALAGRMGSWGGESLAMSNTQTLGRDGASQRRMGVEEMAEAVEVLSMLVSASMLMTPVDSEALHYIRKTAAWFEVSPGETWNRKVSVGETWSIWMAPMSNIGAQAPLASVHKFNFCSCRYRLCAEMQ